MYKVIRTKCPICNEMMKYEHLANNYDLILFCHNCLGNCCYCGYNKIPEVIWLENRTYSVRCKRCKNRYPNDIIKKIYEE